MSNYVNSLPSTTATLLNNLIFLKSGRTLMAA
jgi:hypothetical protein